MRTIIAIVLGIIVIALTMNSKSTDSVLEPSTVVDTVMAVTTTATLNQEYQIIRGMDCEMHVRLVNDRLELHCTNKGHRITYHVDPTLHNETVLDQDSTGNHLSFYAPRNYEEWHGTITPDTTHHRKLHPGV